MSLDIYLIRKKYVSYNQVDWETEEETVFETNITHNLNRMASEVGIYEAIWQPYENGFDLASSIVPVLENGIGLLKSDPEKYKAFNPSNGWGSYDIFVPWLERLLEACKEYPNTKIIVSR